MSEGDAKQGKAHLSIVVCGHVDAGKSTTTGRLLYDLGGIPPREMEKLKDEAKKLGKESFAFAFYMDRNKDERERGVTIACTVKEFFTDNYHYSIIDAPGHRDFIKNMITGSSQADVALLLLPADGNFETAIARGDHAAGTVQGQTRQHARLLNLLGCKQLVVGVNKMDETLAGYKESRYTEVVENVKDCLRKVGWNPAVVENIPYIAMSGFKGDNIVKKSDKMDWYKGKDCVVKTKDGEKKVHVHTLLDALNDMMQVPDRDAEGTLRMPVGGVHKIPGVGTVITGRIERGTVKPGQEVVFPPTHSAGAKSDGKTFSIELHHKSVEAAHPGDNVGICVKALNKDNMPKPGDVMVLKGDELEGVKTFTLQVQILDHPGELKVGYTPIAYCRTAHSACRMEKIVWAMGKSTGKQKVDDPPHVKAGDMAEIVFAPTQNFVVEAFAHCEGLGRIAIMEGNTVVMLGRVVGVEYLGGRVVEIKRAAPKSAAPAKGKKGKKEKKEKKAKKGKKKKGKK